ncbi:MAG: mechanosensitive ion channel family protein [Halieaceae bacterium]
MNELMENLRQYHPLLPDLLSVALVLLAALLVYAFGKLILVGAAHRFAARTEHTWDDALIEHRVPGRLAQLLPVFVVYAGADYLWQLQPAAESLLLRATSAYMIMVVTFTLTAVLGAANSIYESYPASRQRPLKGFVQLLQLVLIIIAGLLVIAELLDRSPWILLSGFGAMTAVLLLVFKDTILSLVASVQLTAQDLVRVGDWIEVPQFGADGDVIDVELHTIKVQNWDKTITTIPTHRLISDSFKNWRGMSQSGGRRIKRSIALDASSIRFLSQEEVDKFKRFALLHDYVSAKQSELGEHNDILGASADGVNQRRLTNIGTFRAYIYNYLKQHPQIHPHMTLLVRQLAPGSQGVPIELYCFTTTTNWNAYEGIQGDIFDHLLAIVPEFGLLLYQQPAGSDIASLAPVVKAPAAGL